MNKILILPKTSIIFTWLVQDIICRVITNLVEYYFHYFPSLSDLARSRWWCCWPLPRRPRAHPGHWWRRGPGWFWRHWGKWSLCFSGAIYCWNPSIYRLFWLVGLRNNLYLLYWSISLCNTRKNICSYNIQIISLKSPLSEKIWFGITLKTRLWQE